MRAHRPRTREGPSTEPRDCSLGSWPPLPASLRREQLAADPSEAPWLVRAMVLRAPRQVVGSVGFHAPPDRNGRVEIGYDVVVTERRKGYAREGVRGLAARAFATGEAQVCVASISPDNAASLALVRSLGFRQVGQQIDDVDGLELVFERPLPLAPTATICSRSPSRLGARSVVRRRP
jgi:ribosomal-protein-alanine N-acetyltransferase